MTARQRRDLAVSVATVIISLIVMLGAGVFYTSVAIERNNDAICDVLLAASVPLPDPPPGQPGQPQPSTEYGQLLKEYNDKVNARGNRIQESFNQAIKKYHCE
jgi:hypothetical protein